MHYPQCGLNNVWLENGFLVGEAADEEVIVTAPEELHRLIGQLVVALPRPLLGVEFQYLRRELDLTARQLAELLGCTIAEAHQSEKSLVELASGTNADREIRILYLETFGGELAAEPEDRPSWHLAREPHGWFLVPLEAIKTAQK